MQKVEETKSESVLEGVAAGDAARAGGLPPWGRDDLPEPLPFSAGNLMRTIGPGAILLATSIGGGE